MIARVRDVADRRELHSAAALNGQWVDSADALFAAQRTLALPAGEGYAGCAGEASAVAVLRRILLDEKGLGAQAIRAAVGWKREMAAQHENLAG